MTSSKNFLYYTNRTDICLKDQSDVIFPWMSLGFTVSGASDRSNKVYKRETSVLKKRALSEMMSYGASLDCRFN